MLGTYNPLARYTLIEDGEQIHAAMYPGSFAGELFTRQMEVSIRMHAPDGGHSAIEGVHPCFRLSLNQ